MKRYNIHLDEDWVKDLDEITSEVKKVWNKRHMWGNTSRADIIRVGLSIAFSLKQTHIHHLPDELTEIVKHVISKRKNRQGV